MDIGFRKITDFPRGTLCDLLKEGYAFEPRFEQDCLNQWQEFDKFFGVKSKEHRQIIDEYAKKVTVMLVIFP